MVAVTDVPGIGIDDITQKPGLRNPMLLAGRVFKLQDLNALIPGVMSLGEASELLTLSIAGTTTDTTALLLPANSLILAVSGRVQTTITTATSWALGDATTAARFAAANATMTAGATSVGILQWSGAVTTLAAGPSQAAAAAVRVTTVGTPGAGKIRITVVYITFAATTS